MLLELSNLAVKDEKEWREKKGRRRLRIGRERDTHDVGGRRLPQHCPRVGMEPCLASKILQVFVRWNSMRMRQNKTLQSISSNGNGVIGHDAVKFSHNFMGSSLGYMKY